MRGLGPSACRGEDTALGPVPGAGRSDRARPGVDRPGGRGPGLGTASSAAAFPLDKRDCPGETRRSGRWTVVRKRRPGPHGPLRLPVQETAASDHSGPPIHRSAALLPWSGLAPSTAQPAPAERRALPSPVPALEAARPRRAPRSRDPRGRLSPSGSRAAMDKGVAAARGRRRVGGSRARTPWTRHRPRGCPDGWQGGSRHLGVINPIDAKGRTRTWHTTRPPPALSPAPTTPPTCECTALGSRCARTPAPRRSSAAGPPRPDSSPTAPAPATSWSS